MKWIETTNEHDPLTCRGEYSCDIPWLQHTTNGGIAYYSVRKDFSGLWETMFWHGNRGHYVSKPSKTEIEAKAECLEHLKRMYAGFSVQIGKILRSYEEEAMYEKKKAIKEAFKDGDWVFGIGPHEGCSQVFTGSSGDFQPFDYLNDYDPAHFRIATDKEIDEAKKLW